MQNAHKYTWFNEVIHICNILLFNIAGCLEKREEQSSENTEQQDSQTYKAR